MGITSFIFTFLTLLLMSELTTSTALIFSLVAAPIAALIELYTKYGLDTVTVPIVASVVLSLTMFI